MASLSLSYRICGFRNVRHFLNKNLLWFARWICRNVYAVREFLRSVCKRCMVVSSSRLQINLQVFELYSQRCHLRIAVFLITSWCGRLWQRSWNSLWLLNTHCPEDTHVFRRGTVTCWSRWLSWSRRWIVWSADDVGYRALLFLRKAFWVYFRTFLLDSFNPSTTDEKSVKGVFYLNFKYVCSKNAQSFSR